MKHAAKRDIGPFVREPAGVEDAEEEQKHAAPHDVLHRRGAAFARERLVEREDQRHADDEKEEREDEVVEDQAVPRHVLV